MKICINCGAEIDENSNFCPHCGTRCEKGKNIERSVYQSSENTTESQTYAYPMKWHNFLMVVMIIGAILTVSNGIIKMSGTDYITEGLDASRVYSIFPGLKICDTVYGIIVIALGVFQFIVRNRLNQYRENGPQSMKILYILSIFANLLYLVWASSVTRISLLNASNLGSIGSSVFFLIINSVYYAKRSALFAN